MYEQKVQAVAVLTARARVRALNYERAVGPNTCSIRLVVDSAAASGYAGQLAAFGRTGDNSAAARLLVILQNLVASAQEAAIQHATDTYVISIRDLAVAALGAYDGPLPTNGGGSSGQEEAPGAKA